MGCTLLLPEKYDSSFRGGPLSPSGDALTTYPINSVSPFFVTLGVHLYPLHPLGTLMFLTPKHLTLCIWKKSAYLADKNCPLFSLMC